MNYDPKEYWEKRLKDYPSLKGVGNIGFNERYNEYLYSLKVSALNRALSKNSIAVKNKRVLDVGYGIGFFINFWLKKGASEIVGIDITELSISILKEKYLNYPNCHFQVADISEPDLTLKFGGDFDIINVLDVLYHIADDEAFKKALNNILSLTRPGGYVLISDVFGDRDILPAEHVHFRSYREYKEMLQNRIEILDILPMYYLMNRSFHLPALLLNKLSPVLYLVDKNLQRLKVPNGSNIKLLVGIKRR